MNCVSAANQARSAGSYRTRPACRRSTAFSCRSTSNSASLSPSPRTIRTARLNSQRISRQTILSSTTGSANHRRASHVGEQAGQRHDRVSGRHRFGDRGYFIEPTVLTNTRPDMKVVREEIFGPVLVATPFTDLNEIAAVANDSDYGLGAGIWTRDISKAHALAKKIRAGTVWINCYNVFDAALPFGGYKQSGWGREMGHEALHAYTEVKAVTTQL